MSDDGCQGASAELSATQVKKLEELEERIDKLTDIYEEATNTLHASCSSEQQAQGLDNQTTPKTTQPVDEHKSDDDKHDEQPDKQSYKPVEKPPTQPGGDEPKEFSQNKLCHHHHVFARCADSQSRCGSYNFLRS